MNRRRRNAILGAAAVAAAALALLRWGPNVWPEGVYEWVFGPVTAAHLFEDMQRQMRREKADWERAGEQLPKSHREGRRTDKFDMLDVQPEDWYATPEAKFAHSIKIPNPVPEDSGWRRGMSQREYFEHLCKTEAGEFIFRTVDNVEGIFQLRPRPIKKPADMQHLYAMEDPYGYYDDENENIGFHMVEPLKYSFFEIPVAGVSVYAINLKRFFDDSIHIPASAGASIARYVYSGAERYDDKNVKLEYDTKPKARYGFTWRGIKRPHDREMGIAGGELIVLDLQTNEVLGLRRGYVIWNRGWTFRVCPRYGFDGGEDKGTDFTARFVMRVVKPPRWKEYFERRERTRVIPPGGKRFDQ